MSDSTTTLSSDGVQTGMSSSQSASVLLQTYTNTVLQTPIITLDPSIDTLSNSNVVEQLPQDQKTAQTNALNYLNNINPLIVSTVAEVIGFGNLWNAEYAQLLALAQDITSGNNAQIFASGLQNLITKTTQAGDQIDPVLAALNAFLPLIQQDASNFSTDLNNVNIALSGEGGQIQQLQDEIDAYNEAMSKDLAIIAAGATADVVGGLAIAVGLLAEIETGGVSTALVVGGLAMIAGGTAAMGVAGADYSDKKSAYAGLVTELAQDQQVYTLTSQASATIATLVSAVQGGITAVEALQTSWTSLAADFQQVIEALDMANPDLGAWLTSILEAANSDWQDTLALAKSIQQYDTLPVSTDTSLLAVA